MICCALDALSHLPASDIFVILGAYGDEIAPVLGKDATVITNENWATGMGSSIACGMQSVMTKGDYDGVMITLCDQINLTGHDYDQLIAPFDGTQIVATRHPDGLGVPAVFPKASFDDLRNLSGPIGARKIINSHKANLVAIDLPNAVLDIDTKDDLAKATHQPA